MRIVELEALSTGAHRNQESSLKTVPYGWAVIKEGIELPNFPFGEPVVTDGVVTSWIAGEITIMPSDAPAPEQPPTLEDLQAENKLLRAQVGVLQEQQTFLEDCLLEMADEVYA